VAQGQLHGIGQPGPDVRLDHQPVHHQIQGVALVFFQFRQRVQTRDPAVHPDAHEPLGLELGQAVGLGALLVRHQRGHEDQFRALGQGHEVGDDLVQGAGLDGPAAARAVGPAETGEEHAQEIVDLGHGAHGGAGVSGGRLLLQGDGRGQALDLVHLGLVELGQELPGVGRQRLHVAPLALGVDDVEGQGGLARAAGPADDHELAARDVQVQVLEVVLAGAFDVDNTRKGHDFLRRRAAFLPVAGCSW
jgi:hypothetical protein